MTKIEESKFYIEMMMASQRSTIDAMKNAIEEYKINIEDALEGEIPDTNSLTTYANLMRDAVRDIRAAEDTLANLQSTYEVLCQAE